MSDFLREMFSPIAVGTTGAALVLIGVLLWILARTSGRVSVIRREYASRLRAAGEAHRASKLEAETTMLLGRFRRYAGAFVLGGVAAIFVSLVSSA
jgi:hypothetical protein